MGTWSRNLIDTVYTDSDLIQVTIRVDGLGALFTASLATYLVYGPTNVTPSSIGFSLNMATQFSSRLLAWISWLNQLERES
jgi:ABC-type multidrug transport system fused ATPase/permease subunit